MRNGKTVLCECCDFTDDEEMNANNDDGGDSTDLNGSPAVATASDTDELSSEPKRAKMESASEKEPVKIQPGWYGKGYRKAIRRRKKRSYQLP